MGIPVLLLDIRPKGGSPGPHRVPSCPSAATPAHQDGTPVGQQNLAARDANLLGRTLTPPLRTGLGEPYDPSLSKQQLFEEAKRRFENLEADLAWVLMLLWTHSLARSSARSHAISPTHSHAHSYMR